MKKRKLLSLLLALAMMIGLAACSTADNPESKAPSSGGQESKVPDEGGDDPEETLTSVEDSEFFGPIYDEWSTMTDEELYAKAIEEVEKEGPINVYATSSKMLKNEEKWLETYPELEIAIMDMDQDEVLEKCVLEHDSGNILGDVLQAKDVNGDVFFDYYEEGICSAFYPKDIAEKVDEDLLRFGYPLYASQSFWYYNTEAYPDGQPVTNW